MEDEFESDELVWGTLVKTQKINNYTYGSRIERLHLVRCFRRHYNLISMRIRRLCRCRSQITLLTSLRLHLSHLLTLYRWWRNLHP